SVMTTGRFVWARAWIVAHDLPCLAQVAGRLVFQLLPAFGRFVVNEDNPPFRTNGWLGSLIAFLEAHAFGTPGSGTSPKSSGSCRRRARSLGSEWTSAVCCHSMIS